MLHYDSILKKHAHFFWFYAPLDMASRYAPLSAIERQQLRTQPNVDLILAWATIKGIIAHPEVLEQVAIKDREAGEISCILF